MREQYDRVDQSVSAQNPKKETLKTLHIIDTDCDTEKSSKDKNPEHSAQLWPELQVAGRAINQAFLDKHLDRYNSWLRHESIRAAPNFKITLVVSSAATMNEESKTTDLVVDTMDLPIALRRSKRGSNAVSPTRETPAGDDLAFQHAAPNTPSNTKRAKKRVRFSDPGLSTTTNSTGLTPHMNRTSLSTPRRRASTPLHLSASLDASTVQEIQFTPFRQVLDDRVKRRIRRRGLSDEMNEYEAERKSKLVLEREVYEKDEELRKLREELEAARQSSANEGHNETECGSSQRIDEVEAELAALRESFNGAVMNDEEWTNGNWDDGENMRGGMMSGLGSDSGDTIPIYEDEDAAAENPSGFADLSRDDPMENLDQDAELLAMALDLETAKQEKRQLFKELRSHLPPASDGQASSSSPNMEFEDSPASSNRKSFNSTTSSLQSPPKDFYRDVSKALKSTKSRAEDAELALHALEVELKTMGFAGNDSFDVLAEVQAHFRNARMELERIMPGETVSGLTENTRLLPELLAKIKSLLHQLRDREGEMRTMRDQQKSLKGNFDHSIVATEKANARVRELEDAIETGAEEMLECRMRVQQLEKEIVENHKTISSLITALEKYRVDVAKMEQVMTELESAQPFQIQEATDAVRSTMEQQISDCEAKIAAEERGRKAAEAAAIDRLARMKELEAGMVNAQAHAMEVQLQLNALAAEKDEEEFKLKKKLLEAGEQHSAQLSALNTRISNLSTALASANAEVEKVTYIKSRIERRLQVVTETSGRAVECMHLDFVRSAAKANEIKNSYLRGTKILLANGELEDEEVYGALEGPLTPVSLVRFVDLEAEDHVQGFVETERGKNRHSSGGRPGKVRRRFDSGIGMESLSEAAEEEGSLHDDADLPADAPSSEADVEML